MHLFTTVGTTLFLGLTATLSAATTEEIYQKYCASCHFKQGSVNAYHKKALIHKMQTADKDELADIQAELNNDMDDDERKFVAPPFSKVTKRLSSEFDNKSDFVDFVKSYIKDPSQERGQCRPWIYERFGVMPPISPEMTEQEMDKIANWLYTSFRLYRVD